MDLEQVGADALRRQPRRDRDQVARLGDPALAGEVAQSSRSLRRLVQSSAWIELIPNRRFIRRTVSSRGETARTGTRGRCAEIRRAVRPELVGQTIAFSPSR